MAYEKSKVSNFGSGTLSSPPPLVGFEYCHQVSRVPGEAPELGSLGEGELALNAADGVAYYRTATGGVGSFPSGDGITKIVSLTQAAYDALTPVATTLYIVTPNP